VLAGGVDFPIIGRAAMLHHDYPQRLASDPSFVPVPLPVTMAHLREQGLSDTFVNYVGSTWKDFMSDFAAAAPGT
jgi:hypothetical protein